eukprot:TRINITY_DN25733_c0_g1_i1.p1 TRINITY_DN25733_c0_g1~~TRINITY_DN25733_c0_g1_i1.p1  ORF type:complete len:1041 (-),score=88.12 TRINITY_DN25733_c0_g1_i1:1-3123(-)
MTVSGIDKANAGIPSKNGMLPRDNNGGVKRRHLKNNKGGSSRGDSGVTKMATGVDIQGPPRGRRVVAMFQHMFERQHNLADLRRRALTLIDVCAERNASLKPQRLLVALCVALVYVLVLFLIFNGGGPSSLYEDRSYERAGGPWSNVRWESAVAVTLGYITILLVGVGFMQSRPPIQARVFEFMLVYNVMQFISNALLSYNLWTEAWRLHYPYPWGNTLDTTMAGHRMGMLLWIQYYCRQFELCDTVFIVLRKQFHQMTFLHVFLRLVNLWGWFYVCRFACGGDSYFPAAVNSSCQVIVYLYYAMSLILEQGMPWMRKARVTEVQVLQFVVCATHATYVLVHGNLPRSVAALSLFVMLSGLVLYVEWDNGQPQIRIHTTPIDVSMFGHLYQQKPNLVDLRRRALTLIDVVMERENNGPLRPHRVLAAFVVSLGYWWFVLPACRDWGTGLWYREGRSEVRAGGPWAEVHSVVAILITVVYCFLVYTGVHVMERRPAVQKRVFEYMFIYNVTQVMLNASLGFTLWREAWQLGFKYPWGNSLDTSTSGDRLGMLLWFQYHCRQLELLDTFFIVLRKKFHRMTFLQVWLRLMHMWGWFFACRYACGGDSYFPAAVNSTCQVFVYSYYALSLLYAEGVPLMRKARVTEVQVAQFVICAAHASYVLWQGNLPRGVAALSLSIMCASLLLYVDFAGEQPLLQDSQEGDRLTFRFDSSGWFYVYHFGVATWLREHILPENMSPDDAVTDKYPHGVAFSGSSGGGLVAASLASAVDVPMLFEYVLEQLGWCKIRPWNMFKAVESAMRKFLPENAAQSMSGRARVLLTRVSIKPPFITGEAVDQFGEWDDTFRGLRASCHVPGLHFLPYRYHDRYYFDGLVWSSLLVPWSGDSSSVVKVSATGTPLSDIRAPVSPPWWTLIPPSEDALRGMFWVGYRDVHSWFVDPPVDSLSVCKCRAGARRPGSSSEPDDALFKSRSAKHQRAQKLLLRKPEPGPNGDGLPEKDPVTGQLVADLVACYRQSVDRNFKAATALMIGLGLIGSYRVCNSFF